MAWPKGRKRIFTKQHKERLAKAQTGKKYSKESREKMSKSHLGHIPWNKGIPMDEDLKTKISITKTKCRINNNGYCDQWFDFEYREDCRKKYCEKCKINEVRKIGSDGRNYTNLHLHHEDFDKKNCHPDNLITLCNSCHTKKTLEGKKKKWLSLMHFYRQTGTYEPIPRQAEQMILQRLYGERYNS